MASKVMVKIPVAPFGQVNKNKSGNEIVVTRSQEISPRNGETPKGPEQIRIAQLEQNIRFLQEQHQLMLAGLHTEIQSLKNRNRELQFQLVFVKGGTPSSPSSPEDDAKHKVYSSPKPFNTTPLQVELLEKDLGELRLQMQETESRNVYLSAIVDEQKKKLERYERDREKERERASGQPDPELLRKLDDAEVIIRRLRRENSDLRRENAAHFSPREPSHHRENGFPPRSGSGQNSGNRGNGGRHRGSNGHFRGNWFPPLHSQSYWQGGRQSERSNLPVEGSSALPSLQSNETHYQGRRGANNNHYQQNEGRKYRGGQKHNSKQT